MAQNGPKSDLNPKLWPRWWLPFLAGLSSPNGLRGSHCGAAALEALSCGRDRVRWPCRWLFECAQPAVEPAALADPWRGRLARAAPPCSGGAFSARHPEIEFVKAPYLNDHTLVLDSFAERPMTLW